MNPMPQLSGWLWFVVDVVFVALLVAAIIYGIMKWRHRRQDPAMEQVRENATRRVYRQEEATRRAKHEV
jgi:flagellar biosynthesis/type III secretory pathway M-ring protein FliF/YscJ